MTDWDVEIDAAGMAELEAELHVWTSDIGHYIEQKTEEVHAAAVAMAPVSPKGSKYAPVGFLKTRVAVTTEHHTTDGRVLGLVGVPLRAGSRYPYDFVANMWGVTRNANQYGHYGLRPARNYFLSRALVAVMGGE